MQSDFPSYNLARTNSRISRPGDYWPQMSYKFGIKKRCIDKPTSCNGKIYNLRFLKIKSFTANLNNTHFTNTFLPLYVSPNSIYFMVIYQVRNMLGRLKAVVLIDNKRKKHLDNRRRVQNPIKHLRWSFLRFTLTSY